MTTRLGMRWAVLVPCAALSVAAPACRLAAAQPTPATRRTDASAARADAAPDAAPGLWGSFSLSVVGGSAGCVQLGGHIRPVFSRRPGPRLEVCWVPSPDDGHACADDSDCRGGRCLCTGDLGRPNAVSDPALTPRDGSPAVGSCSSQSLPSGDWYCLVRHGHADLHGIIID